MAVTRDELLRMIGEKLGQSAGGGQQRTQPTEKSDEERAKYKALADKEYQRVQSVKKLSGTYNPVEREKAQMAQRDALVAADNEAIGHRKNAALAQKDYDDYVKSPEFQKNKQEAAAKLTRGVPASEIPRNAPQMMEAFEDETAQGLKAKADHYRKLADDEKNRRVMAQDMAEINAMPEEDRKLFEQYAESQNTQQDVFAYTNPIRWFWHQNEVTDAWKPLVEKYGEEHLAELKESYDRYTSQQMVEQIAQDVHTNNDAAGSAVA